MPIIGRFGSLAGLGSLILPGGAMESIATVSVGSGGASSVSFSDIPSGFQHLQIRWVGRCTDATARRTRIRFNGDTAANYSIHLLAGDGATAIAAASASVAQTSGSALSASNDLSNAFVASIEDVLDYASTTKNKTVRSFSGADYNGGAGGSGAGQVNLWSGAWYSTSAVTSLSIFWTAGNWAQHSQVALYGLRAP